MMPIRLIAADLDDTLLRSDKTISEETVRVIARVRALGAKFILSTGRMPAAIAKYSRLLRLTEPAICYNGALVADVETGEITDSTPIPAQLARQICREAESQGLYIQAYRGDEYYAQSDSEFGRKYSAKLGPEAPLIHTGVQLSEFVDFDTPKLLIVDRAERAAGIIAHFQAVFGEQVDCMVSQPDYVEIMIKGVDKGLALARLCRAYGFGPENALAFGDSGNDLTMLRVAGIGCAVANARREVLEACDMVAPSNNSDGVASVLRQLMIEGRIGEGGPHPW